MKYDPYHKIDSVEKYNSTPNSSYVGLGRGKGKLMHPVSLLQRGQEYKRRKFMGTKWREDISWFIPI